MTTRHQLGSLIIKSSQYRGIYDFYNHPHLAGCLTFAFLPISSFTPDACSSQGALSLHDSFTVFTSCVHRQRFGSFVFLPGKERKRGCCMFSALCSLSFIAPKASLLHAATHAQCVGQTVSSSNRWYTRLVGACRSLALHEIDEWARNVCPRPRPKRPVLRDSWHDCMLSSFSVEPSIVR
jgi:hypothetical protein